jgi:hypothetical protein
MSFSVNASLSAVSRAFQSRGECSGASLLEPGLFYDQNRGYFFIIYVVAVQDADLEPQRASIRNIFKQKSLRSLSNYLNKLKQEPFNTEKYGDLR